MTKLLIYYFVGITGAIDVGLWYNTIVISCIGRLIFIYTGGFMGLLPEDTRPVFVSNIKAVDI